MENIRYPSISPGNIGQQMADVQAFLYQLVEQLNMVLQSIPAAGAAEPAVNYDEVKSMIIRSSDIINAYYKTFKERFDNEYARSLDFSIFQRDVNGRLLDIDIAISGIQTAIEEIRQIIEELEARVPAAIAGGVADDVFAFADSCEAGLSVFYTDENTLNLPEGDFAGAFGEVRKSDGTRIHVLLTGYAGSKAQVTKNGDTYGEWVIELQGGKDNGV